MTDGSIALHQPVMWQACIEALAIRPAGLYVDGTFGRGGHSAEILRRLGPEGRLIAIDQDPEAVQVGARWSDRRFEIVHARFCAIDEILAARGIARIDGVLLDLGVSSPQLDDAHRGFSFRVQGPLDMRMDPTRGAPVREWLLKASEEEVAEVLRRYGEERFAVPIAKAIAARCRDAGSEALRTTTELAAVVAGVLRRRGKKPEKGKDPATRTFQALRIFVNQELEDLARFLDRILDLLALGGRLVILAFHSLEDRLVKQFIARESGRDAPRHPVTGAPAPQAAARLRALGRVLPSPAEIAANPRSRSAVLRIAERL